MLELYPNNIGVYLNHAPFEKKQIKPLLKMLPDSLLVHVYGLRLVGKTRVSELLAELLEAELISEILITRAIAYAITQKPKQYENHEFQPYFENLSFEKVARGIVPIYNGVRIPLPLTHNKKTLIMAQNLEKNEKFTKHLSEYCEAAVKELTNKKVVYISNFATPRGQKEIVSAQKPTESILLLCQESVVWERFLKLKLMQNGTTVHKAENEERLEVEYEKLVLETDEILAEQALRGPGLLTKESLVVDTSTLVPEQIVESLFSYWANELM